MVGSFASLGANVAVAEPGLIGRVVAAWPSLALIGSYELLMSQIRRCAEDRVEPQELPALPPDLAADAEAEPVEPHDGQEKDAAAAEPKGDGRVLQREAWRWAQQNRQEDGDLPSGVAIARAFARSPRWGRLVKKAGLAGELT
ncbi:hypothetical protein [Microbispora bryophytorum]|uniref:hypothetical protein n=1 Tax=Microbispora bryophytorum TaxID=1460882 RepID=UPI003407242A